LAFVVHVATFTWCNVAGREVLEPYLSRAKMTDEEQRKFLKKQDAVIIGFSLPLYLAICLPYIGMASIAAAPVFGLRRECLHRCKFGLRP
jgi:hypothetical protein